MENDNTIDFIKHVHSKITQKDEILDFINRRFKKDCDWLTGNCYYFACILKLRFNYVTIYYDCVAGHFVVFNPYNNCYYDWTGIVDVDSNNCVYLHQLKETDESWYLRIVRDTIV